MPNSRAASRAEASFCSSAVFFFFLAIETMELKFDEDVEEGKSLWLVLCQEQVFVDVTLPLKKRPS